ncbi:MAG: hypothetical protein M1420_05850 [Actinobacteria bacterium]|jgi:hypothetical protein|nr:hypothetical protein [Actinomycetota bacterium]
MTLETTIDTAGNIVTAGSATVDTTTTIMNIPASLPWLPLIPLGDLLLYNRS